MVAVYPFYSELGDFVTFYARDERCIERRVDDLLTVYLAMTTKELVGCKIKGVKNLLQSAGDFLVSVDAGRVKLAFFFELTSIAKDAELQFT